MFDKRTLTCIAICLAFLLTGCSSSWKFVRTSDLRPTADKIAGYALPEGYTEQFAVDLLDYQLVSLEGQTPNCHIYLAQAPKDSKIDLASVQNEYRAQDERFDVDVRLVETRTVSIRGQDVTLYVSEGVNGENRRYRGVTAMFEGRGGPAAVNITAPVEEWDWALVDAFLASLD